MNDTPLDSEPSQSLHEGRSDAPSQQRKAKTPRLYHKKSRNGCQKCKTRRVKCDETRPICNNCIRHRLECSYLKPPVPTPDQGHTANVGNSTTTERISVHALIEDLSSTSFSQPRAGQDEIPPTISPSYYEDIPESKSRRMLELRLLQNYISCTAPTFPGCHTEAARHLWSVEVPKMAFQFPNLLYAMFATSALQYIVADSGNMEMQSARQHYLGLALREHHKAVSTLSRESADAVFFACILILNDAFASLQIRNIEPYTLPMHWLQMARGAVSVFGVAFNLIKHDPTARAMALLRTKPALTRPEELNRPSNYAHFTTILSFPPPDYDYGLSPSSSTTSYSTISQTSLGFESPPPHPSIPPSHLSAYQAALTYLGAIHHAITTPSPSPTEPPEPPQATSRRFTAFGLQVPKKFIDLVEAKEPRALIIFAHYFALAKCLTLREDPIFWWVGNTLVREVRGIASILPDGWQELMRWPMGVAGLL